ESPPAPDKSVGWAESSRPTSAAPVGLKDSAHPTAHPRVKLTDFGLARHVVESDSLSVTQTGTILGTPLYMSPEQCTGTAAVGPPTDFYDRGAPFSHLLAGRPLFVGESHLSIINMHCKEQPPALQSLNPAVSEGICQIVEKCLAKSADARYANAAAL